MALPPDAESGYGVSQRSAMCFGLWHGLVMKSSVLIKIGVASATFLAGAVLCGSERGGAFAAPPEFGGGVIVKLVRATKECFSDTIYVSGILVPRQEAVVSLDEGTRVTEVLAAAGDLVITGQVLARGTRLVPGPSAGASASAKLASNTITLKAPAAGLVTQSAATVGAVLSPRGEPLFRIMVDNEIELEADVPGIHVPKLKPEETARIKLEDGTELIGQVRLVPAQIDRTTQLGRARLSVAQAPSLRIGMFTEATIDASQSCGVAVPREAILNQTEGTSVQVVRGQMVETRRVRVGLSSDTRFEISEGLNEGDIVVANAGTSLHDGDRVQTILVDEPDN
ncbi:efflux RND transporter periplasmic adaptor subunit [Methylocapsa sp. D3K7]|uniref:efflux RND transporter periplasmic adaptor subunit n=1 Tax=Methylocapsa sp. D3K7 TaxID=3041435 RepID=UPI00244E8BAB|nr:efflux RND transporter periplasmic adaptor subunit [Methylocapsa sp. D3K7]WGJ13035.1 efflux RND transporter periplasmic adaptor subunit [Methylocapsa sp. D3K7]